jgi:hypothetical protein
MSDSPLKLEIVQGDVLEYRADVLGLKYAQHYYGSDEAVSKLLLKKGVAEEEELKPGPGKYVWIHAGRVLPSPRVLFVGVPPLIHFGYGDIADWARRVIAITGRDYPDAEHVAITLHGPGYGLDEIEALHAELRGVVTSVQAGEAPAGLSRVSIVERKPGRVERLRAALAELAPTGSVSTKGEPAAALLDLSRYALASLGAKPTGKKASASRRSSWPKQGTRSVQPAPSSEVVRFAHGVARTNLQTNEQVERKPRAFVAMPFSPDMEDVFYYGIQNPVRQLGYVCERVDQEAFTGDILYQVKSRIENAEVVIADLTGANPNVFLEVGYAWGKARPTVLVIKKAEQMRFDVQGQRCLQYQSIKDLETRLTNELKNLPPTKKR